MDVLIIEPNILQSKRMKKYIVAQGKHNVYNTNNGEEALELINNKCFHLIFLDLLIVDSNGMKLLKIIRKKCMESKIIVITSFPTVKTAVECMKAGANDYWSIPFRMERIKRWLL